MYQNKVEQKDLKKILTTYTRYWYLFAVGVILSLAAAYLYIRYSTPLYRISTTLLIKDENNGTGITESAAFSDLEMFKSTKSIDNELVLLKSNSLLEKAINALDLKTTYYIKGEVRDQEIYGNELPINIIINNLEESAYNINLIIHIKNNNQFEIEENDNKGQKTIHNFGNQIKKPYGTFTVVATAGVFATKENKPVLIKFQHSSNLANLYSQRLNVGLYNNKASAIILSITDAVPQKGIDILNKFVQVYNNDVVNDKNQVAANTVDFIDERLKYLTTELSTVEKNVEEYKRQNKLTDVSSQAQQFITESSNYNKQLSELSIQQDVLASIEKYLSKQGTQYGLVPSSLSISDPTLVNLINRFNQMQIERENLLRSNSVDNPLVQNLNNQLINLRRNILENLRNINNSLTISKRNLQLNSVQFNSKIKQVPVVERQLIEITRQQEIKQELYLYLLKKREESALSLAASVSNSRVIDPPTFTGPVSPNIINTYLYYLLVGLFIPFTFIYVKNLLNNKIQSLDEVKNITPTPILGEVAHSRGGKSLIIENKKRTPLAEMFRLIITNLQFTNAGKENKVMMVTSSMSGEGKTFFSINLGVALAATGKRTVIIDFDLRKPGVLQSMDLVGGNGLSNYLASDFLNLDDIVQTSTIDPNLYAIGAGTIPPNPYELMLSPRVNHLFKVLVANFDYIIVDTAPVGQVADSFSLAPHINSLIYLARYNYTLSEQINIIDDIYVNRKFNQPMIVLNDAKLNNKYGYGYGYAENKPKRSLFNLLKSN
ncbi:tyrosine-protein kinase [Rufibacter sp. XAAS-G3-1]|uniref:GumC family protein n=1 Tax=Rufibacter sp. XAAS-G3-1 TaxID=2729134 RepID=UPI0015E63D91|nr:tyrosine-protein kinase [Rufibacter sp. XAAS-G3-1]